MVNFINYSGKQYPVTMGYYALMMLKQETGKDLDLRNMTWEDCVTLLFYSLKLGAQIENQPFTMTKEDITPMLNECFVDFMKLIPQSFPALTEEETKSFQKGRGDGKK